MMPSMFVEKAGKTNGAELGGFVFVVFFRGQRRQVDPKGRT